MAVACPICHGDGTVTVNPAHPDPRGAMDVRCPKCHGTGEVSFAGIFPASVGRWRGSREAGDSRSVADDHQPRRPESMGGLDGQLPRL